MFDNEAVLGIFVISLVFLRGMDFGFRKYGGFRVARVLVLVFEKWACGVEFDVE